jgi:hypothetical protein
VNGLEICPHLLGVIDSLENLFRYTSCAEPAD